MNDMFYLITKLNKKYNYFLEIINDNSNSCQ